MNKSWVWQFLWSAALGVCELTVILCGFFCSFLCGGNNLSFKTVLFQSVLTQTHCYAVLSSAKLTERLALFKLNLICFVPSFVSESKWRTWMLGEECVAIVAWFSYTSRGGSFPQLLANNLFKMKLCTDWKQVTPMLVLMQIEFRW